MKILNQYIARSYLLIFVVSVAVFSFVMCIGSVVRAIDLMSRGVSGFSLLKYFLLSFPYILQFTVPMSAMTTALLLSMRLSMDGEINAMKACGINLWQVVSPLILLSVALSFLAMYVSNFISPQSRYAQRELSAHLVDTDPVALLEEGRFVRDFPGHMIYVGKKRGGRAEDIVIYVMDKRGGLSTSLRARYGTLGVDQERREMVVDLFDVRMEDLDSKAPLDIGKTRVVTAEHYPKRISLKELFKTGAIKKKTSDHTIFELMRVIREIPETMARVNPLDRAREQMKLMVEANTRMAMSVSCFAFTLLGIPLGLRSKRHESSVGVGISLGIVFVFYTFVALTKPMANRPELRPDLIVWIPVAVAELVGLFMIHRSR